MKNKSFLHVGCGPLDKKSTTAELKKGYWKEVRFDIDAGAKPDILGSMVDMEQVPDKEFDALFSSHNIEHLEYHDVQRALKEFRRVLKDNGICIILCPNMDEIARAIVSGAWEEPVYESPAGPISPIDMVYGYRPALAMGQHYMAHRMGYTKGSLYTHLGKAGFKIGVVVPVGFDLIALASVDNKNEDQMIKLFKQHFPGILHEK